MQIDQSHVIGPAVTVWPTNLHVIIEVRVARDAPDVGRAGITRRNYGPDTPLIQRTLEVPTSAQIDARIVRIAEVEHEVEILLRSARKIVKLNADRRPSAIRARRGAPLRCPRICKSTDRRTNTYNYGWFFASHW